MKIKWHCYKTSCGTIHAILWEKSTQKPDAPSGISCRSCGMCSCICGFILLYVRHRHALAMNVEGNEHLEHWPQLSLAMDFLWKNNNSPFYKNFAKKIFSHTILVHLFGYTRWLHLKVYRFFPVEVSWCTVQG